MKLIVAILIASLGLNAALALSLSKRDADIPRELPPPAAKAAVQAPTPSPTPNVATLTSEESDTAKTVESLRALGFPPRALRAYAMDRLSGKYAKARRELGVYRAPQYWEFPNQSILASSDPDVAAKRRKLEQDFQAELRQVLRGDELLSDYDRMERYRTYGDLPAEKASQLIAINKDYSEMQAAIRAQMKGIQFPEDKERFALLEKERQADIAATLSPAELQAYDLRSSETATTVKGHLSNLEVTEAEYRAVFAIQRDLETRYDLNTLRAEEIRELKEAELRKVMTPERFEEYVTKTSGSYLPVLEIVKSLDLPKEAVTNVIAVQRDISRRANTVRNDPSLSSDERNQRLGQLYEEATKKLNESLGDRGMQQYQMIGGMDWYARLRPTNKPKG